MKTAPAEIVASQEAWKAQAERTAQVPQATPADMETPMPAGYPTVEQLDSNGWLPIPRQRLPFPSLVVGSLDDPYMDFATTRKMARLWGSDLVDIGYAGHINIRSGYGRWPTGYELLELLKGESKRPHDRSLAGRQAAPLAAYF